MSTPVLLIHAFPLDHRMWRPQLDALVDRTVIAPDLRGFGPRASGTLPTSVDQHAKDLLDQLDAASISKTIVVGLSMGGYVAMALHRLAPQRIAGIMLADTKAAPDTPEVKRGRNARIDRITQEGISWLAAEMIPSLVAPNCAETVRLELQKIILEQDPHGVIAALTALRDRPDASSSIASIGVPSALICGEFDALTPVPVMREMASTIPGATFTTAAGAGHMSNLESPEAFNQALIDLCTRVDWSCGSVAP